MSNNYLVICRPETAGDDGFRLVYSNFDEAYRKFLHTIWYYTSEKREVPILCSMFDNGKIMYNFVGNSKSNNLVDCFDGSQSKTDLTQEDLSKMILTAVMQYELAYHSKPQD